MLFKNSSKEKNPNEILIDKKFFDEESMKVKVLDDGRISKNQ